jgi:hypothetical protein
VTPIQQTFVFVATNKIRRQSSAAGMSLTAAALRTLEAQEGAALTLRL